MGRTAPKLGTSSRICVGSTRGRVAHGLSTGILSGTRAHARLPALDPPGSSSPDESASEDRSDSGTADSSLGSASSVDDATGVAADSADTDPLVMQGTCLLSWGAYVCCLAWFMCVVMSAMELG